MKQGRTEKVCGLLQIICDIIIIMDKIKYNKDIGLVDPVMIAGWPGMGSVALGVVDYLQRKLAAVKFAEIEVDPLSIIDSVTVEDGLAAFRTYCSCKNIRLNILLVLLPICCFLL